VEIEQVRVRGYAEAIEEREAGLSAVAAPVWGADDTLAAIVALQGPSSRFDATATAAAVPLLLACACRISTALGWPAATSRQRQLHPAMDDSGLTPTPLRT